MKIAIAIALCLISAAVGAIFGVRWGVAQGASHFAWVDAAPRSLVLVGYLRQLRSGQTESVINQLELELDMQIGWHDKLLQEGKPYLLDNAVRGYLEDDPRYMKRVVAYRREFPSVIGKHPMPELPPNATAEERQFYSVQVEGGKDLEAAIERVMQLYGEDGDT